MKCQQCIAWNGMSCLAGINPYMLKCKRMGCCCNTQQVKKYMQDEAASKKSGDRMKEA